MAIRMRLRRTGTKKQAYYRVVVAESTSPRDGRFIEVVGHYDPNRDPAHIEFDEARTLYWLKSGAHPTDTVRSLLSKKGLLARLAEEHPGHAVLARPARKKGRQGADGRAEAEDGPVGPDAVEVVADADEAAGEETAAEVGAGSEEEAAVEQGVEEGAEAAEEPAAGEDEGAEAAEEPAAGEEADKE